MIEIVTDAIWPKITRAAKTARRGDVAVAYFGQGAAKLLPLGAGSRLVVDASERAVRSGQTCPLELLTLMRRGVDVYSVEHLHAKVFVFGNAAFVGSTNASLRSKNVLIEAVLRTSDRHAVVALRAFVRGLCIDPLRATQVERLTQIYHPPKFEGGKPVGTTVSKARRRRAVTLPKVRIVQLHRKTRTDAEEQLFKRGASEATKKRINRGRQWYVDDFDWSPGSAFREREKIIQVTTEDDGRAFVHPTGTIIHVKPFKSARGAQRAFVYLECRADQRRRDVGSVAKALGRGWKKRLLKSGVVTNPDDQERILGYWER